MKLSRQFDSMDCGPACIRMVAEHHGKLFPLNYLRNLSYLARDGVSVAGIHEGLEAIGFQANSYKMTLQELSELCPLPAILHWNQNHFVVLYRIRCKKNGKAFYYVADPAYGKHCFTEEDFAAEWLSGEKGVALAVEPTPLFYAQDPPHEEHTIGRFIRQYLRPYRNEMAQLALGLLAGVVTSLIAPFLTQAMIDRGVGDRDLHVITIIVIAQLSLFLGGYVINLIRNWVVLYMSTRINIRIISDFLEKLMRLPMKFFETKSVGDFNQRISDHYRLESFTTSETLMTIFSLISFSVFFVIIGLYSVRILIVYVVFTLLSIGWMIYFLRKRKAIDYKLFRIRTENQNAIFEMINGMSEIKLNNFQNYKRREWQKIQEKLYRTRMKSLGINQTQGAGYVVLNQSRNIIVTFIVAVAVVRGEITLGMMMSITYIIGQMSSPLSQLIGFVQRLQDAKISLERSGEVHLQENEDSKEDYLPVPAGSETISVEHLGFRYGGSYSKWVLKDVDFVIPRGKTTAIVGESGSGKTTFIKLLLKFYPLIEGGISLVGRSLDAVSADDWRSRCGIVMQDNFIFADTIERNIVLGDEEIDYSRLGEAIRIANLTTFLARQPMGLQTKIGTAGMGISGGEKQRIMIARAVYKNPDYLFLDEATSSLDAENERIIVENLDAFFRGKTVVVIAHRLSTVRNAHQIVVLKEGHVEEIGNHKELVARRGVYYNLVHNQLELSQ